MQRLKMSRGPGQPLKLDQETRNRETEAMNPMAGSVPLLG